MAGQVAQVDEHTLTMLPRATKGRPDHPIAAVDYAEDARGLCSCGWTSGKCLSTDEVAQQHAKHRALMDAVA